MSFLTDFADQAVVLPFVLTVAMVLGLSGRRRAAAAWLGAVLGTFAAMLALKLLFVACGSAVPAFEIRSPSGHTAAAAVTYGGLAVLLGAPAALALAVSGGTAILVGLSRVLLGMHSVPEVVVGAVVGVAGTGVVARIAGPPLSRRRSAVLLAALVLVVALFHGVHLHAEPAIGRLARLLDMWPLSACRHG